MRHTRCPLASGSVDWRVAALAGFSGLAVAAGVYAVTDRALDGHSAAQAIARGIAEAQRPPADAQALEDERLTGDANEAGYRWAERRGLDEAARCPAYSEAFRDGCVDYVKEQRNSEP